MVTISFTGFSIQLNILPNINDMGLLIFFVKINRPVIIIIIIIMVYSEDMYACIINIIITAIGI